MRVSSVTLARGIGADPSLVSRWRSGERVPSGETLGIIADFMSGVALLPNDQKTLEEMVGTECSGRTGKAEAIAAWLRGEKTASAFASTDGLLEAFSRQTAYKAQCPIIKSGISAGAEYFEGENVAIQAAAVFLAYCGRLRGITVNMAFFGGIEWLTGDSGNAGAIGALLETSAAEQIRVYLPEPEQGIAKWLEAGLPLTKRMSFFACEKSPVIAAFWARGAGRVIFADNGAVFIKDSALCAPSGMFSEPKAEPFAEALADMDEYMNALLAMQESKGLYYVEKPSFSAFFIPPEFLRDTMSGARGIALIRQRELFERHARDDLWVEALPGALLDAIIINGTCAVPGIELFADTGITLGETALRRTLTAILDCLERFPGYHVVWNDDNPGSKTAAFCAEELIICSQDPFRAARIAGRHSRFNPKELDKPREKEIIREILNSL